MQDSKTRAAVASRLLSSAILKDDQAAFDFLADTVRTEGLHVHFASDNGQPFETADHFLETLMGEVV